MTHRLLCNLVLAAKGAAPAFVVPTGSILFVTPLAATPTAIYGVTLAYYFAILETYHLGICNRSFESTWVLDGDGSAYYIMRKSFYHVVKGSTRISTKMYRSTCILLVGQETKFTIVFFKGLDSR